MRAELKRISSPDCEDLKTFNPEDGECFSLLLQIFVGKEDHKAEESFDVELCTPKYLLNNYSEDKILIGNRMIVVFNYNYLTLEQQIRRYCQNCTGITWEEVACKLMRMGKWEFEDYLP
jgi:hypothetical protein